MATPWGSARWGAARGEGVSHGGGELPAPHPAAPLVLFLCGADKWTHGISIVASTDTGTGTGTDATTDTSGAEQDGPGPATVVRLTSRSTGEVQDLHLIRKVHGLHDGRHPAAAAAAAGGSATGLGLLEAPHPSGDRPPPPSEVAEVAAALLARDAPLADGPDASAAAVRRQRIGSWRILEPCRGLCNPSHHGATGPATLATQAQVALQPCSPTNTPATLLMRACNRRCGGGCSVRARGQSTAWETSFSCAAAVRS